MAKVLKADCSAVGDSYAQKNLAAPQADVWLTAEVRFDSAAFAAWGPGYSGAFLAYLAGTTAGVPDGIWTYDPGGGMVWSTEDDGDFAAPAPTADAWHTLELHYLVGATDSTVTAYVDGIAGPAYHPPTGTLSVYSLLAGQSDGSSPQVAANVAYVRSVKAGTSRGNDDLFADDFSSGDLSAWDSVVGAVSVVDDPFAPIVVGGEGGEGGAGAGLWFLDLLDQNGSDDPNARELVASSRPEQLHFLLQEGKLGPDEVECELSLYARDDDGQLIVSPDFIGPDRSDFRLRRDDLPKPITCGEITLYGGADAGEEHVKIAGKSYLHYLERRVWPYDATLSYTNWPDGFRFKVTNAEVAQIVKDVLETIRDVSPNFPGPPTDALPSYSLDFTVDVQNTGKRINYEISPFDQESIYDKIRTLAEMDRQQGGFDFHMRDAAKTFRLYYPEYGDPDEPVLVLEVDLATQLANMLQAGLTNTGPEATHVLGVGAGTSSRQGGVNRHFRESSRRYRRRDKVADFGDVKNLDLLESLTGAALQFAANPVHEVPITVDPKQIPDFWKLARPGKYVEVAYDLGYHILNSVHKIASMDCTVTLEGDESVTFGLNQHYPTNNPARAGLDDF
jgi:hypothetical protein